MPPGKRMYRLSPRERDERAAEIAEEEELARARVDMQRLLEQRESLITDLRRAILEEMGRSPGSDFMSMMGCAWTSALFARLYNGKADDVGVPHLPEGYLLTEPPPAVDWSKDFAYINRSPVITVVSPPAPAPTPAPARVPAAAWAQVAAAARAPTVQFGQPATVVPLAPIRLPAALLPPAGRDARPKLPPPGEYTGKLDRNITCVRTWWGMLLEYFRVLDTDPVQNVPFYLKGSAQEWIVSYYAEALRQGRARHPQCPRACLPAAVR